MLHVSFPICFAGHLQRPILPTPMAYTQCMGHDAMTGMPEFKCVFHPSHACFL